MEPDADSALELLSNIQYLCSLRNSSESEPKTILQVIDWEIEHWYKTRKNKKGDSDGF